MSLLSRLRSALKDRHYEVQKELGRGSMGRVYLARDLRHDRAVAVKVLDPNITTATGGARFLREIQITAGLQHPHVLPLLDSGEAEELVYYVMPHVEGETVREYLKRKGQLPIDEAIRITSQVAAALQYAHDRDVIHRDIKPDNIMLSAGLAMIGDFGIARALSSRKGNDETSAGMALGTPVYMSPEQAAGDPVDYRTDIYSLGAVLFEMITGHPPFVGDNVAATVRLKLTQPTPLMSASRPGLPAALDGIIQRALARDPGERFQSAKDFEAALAPLQAREALVGTPLDSPRLQLDAASQVPKASRRGPDRLNRLLVVGGFGSLLVIAALLMTGSGGGSGDDETETAPVDSTAFAADGSPARMDSVWGLRPSAGPIGALPLAIEADDSVARAVANGLWEEVAGKAGGAITLLAAADSSRSDSGSVIRGVIGRHGPDLVATFHWERNPGGLRYWSEAYHFPPDEAGRIRAAIVENLTRALSRGQPAR